MKKKTYYSELPTRRKVKVETGAGIFWDSKTKVRNEARHHNKEVNFMMTCPGLYNAIQQPPDGLDAETVMRKARAQKRISRKKLA